MAGDDDGTVPLRVQAQPVVAHRSGHGNGSSGGRSRVAGFSSWGSSRRSGEESGGGGGSSSGSSSSSSRGGSGSRHHHSAGSRSGSAAADDDFWPRRSSAARVSSGGGSSSGSGGGGGSARSSLRLAFHGRRGRDGEDVGGEQGAPPGSERAGRGRGGENRGGRRTGSLFLSLIESEGGGSSRSRLNQHCLDAPEVSSRAMLPGVEVARRRRVHVGEAYEGGSYAGGGGGAHESGGHHSSRSSRSGVSVAHHHHHYHHHHHHHVHQSSRTSSRPGTPRPGSLVRRMQDILQEHRARSPFQQMSSSGSSDGSAPHGTHRRSHGHRAGNGESRTPPLSSFWRRHSSESSTGLRGPALEARNRLDERLRVAAHTAHANHRRSWQAVQSSYDVNFLFSDDEDDNLWSDDDGWETSLHEWLAAWAPAAVEERWNRVDSWSSGRASGSRNPAFKPRPSEGLSKAAINALPRQVVGAPWTEGGGASRSKMEQEDCPVCLEGFVPGQSLISLPCNHKFHPDCLTPWLTNHGQCPYCRADIVKDADSRPEQKNSSGIIGGSDEELLSWVESIERGMDRLSYS